ncbi:bifunctional folylpolyglutamate synthase/dihydrofolate synthase [Vagococcus intermedius]|uniref:Dihydrofolate synthase/folylpolyglutamate synthase n=1 Tax=Vagococcus intermedius TaxID=2991418 RepID=A0AAF0I9Y4_9ENTE|nr:folylpolyglutamate synthase/dihydrofolate synthase family protein [Vagococcus intermedius]WEG73922.1 bifunctional folylpolyglutamate synthase/dihydrofolate synthase [Vagococcus intermedius]WEG76004.1 bifunctional folylpolyglutamate synthase/dihydrofolate synthase [Vagococcus intermedius]
MNYEQAIAWIHGRLPFGLRPGLARIEALLELVGNPQDKLKLVHIGGTNGKGSTVACLRQLLEAEGLRVGTFTSPFIERFNERLSINHQPISDQDLINLVEKYQPLVAKLDQDPLLQGITEFEVITAMMFDYFVEQQVEIGIIEVGLGGLLDSTNVLTPLVSAITTLGLDHMDILGDSLEEIAEQKAGIIKTETEVVLGNIPSKALEVMMNRAQELGSQVYLFGRDFTGLANQSLGLMGENFCYVSEKLRNIELVIPLVGQHQIENASLAIKIYELLAPHLNYPVKAEKIEASLRQVTWPGRMEVLSESPLIMLDGAHNEPALVRLVANLKELFPTQQVTLLFAALTTKDVKKMLEMLATVSNSQLALTTFSYPKAYQLENYVNVVPSKKAVMVSDWQEFVSNFRKSAQENEVLIITGSLYFISEVRAFLLKGEVE